MSYGPASLLSLARTLFIEVLMLLGQRQCWCTDWRNQKKDEKNVTVGLYITESTLELQGLSGGELPELAGGQGELVTLELQGDGGLGRGDAALGAGDVGQLGDLYHISAFNRKEGRGGREDGWRVSRRRKIPGDRVNSAIISNTQVVDCTSHC